MPTYVHLEKAMRCRVQSEVCLHKAAESIRAGLPPWHARALGLSACEWRERADRFRTHRATERDHSIYALIIERKSTARS